VRKRRPETTTAPASAIPGSTAAIVELRDDGSSRLRASQANVTVPNHNVIEREGTLLYNDTNEGRFVAGSVSVPVPGDPSFARGLAHLRDDVFLVGSQHPLAVHAIDLEAREVVQSFDLAGEENESVYAIAVLPETFAVPRGSMFAPAPAEVS
jgi:hypothetical protein